MTSKNLIIFLILFTCLQSFCQLNFSKKQRVIKDLEEIINTERSRNFENVDILDSVGYYIFGELYEVCDTVIIQPFTVYDDIYFNVIGRIGKKNAPKIIVGAHYDVCGDQPGADDNASGVAGLLELARLFSNVKSNYQLEFVAYSLEEPPFFKTEQMGSYIHARSLSESNDKVVGMVCLDMIGYFDSDLNSQNFPLKTLKLFYGTKGNFITVVQKFNNGKFGRQFNRQMKNAGFIPTKSFKAPKIVEGVDFSDHLNYWKFGYSAVMVTNTAFYRNHNYHEVTDTIDTLDIYRMCLVIDEVYLSILNIINN